MVSERGQRRDLRVLAVKMVNPMSSACNVVVVEVNLAHKYLSAP